MDNYLLYWLVLAVLGIVWGLWCFYDRPLASTPRDLTLCFGQLPKRHIGPNVWLISSPVLFQSIRWEDFEGVPVYVYFGFEAFEDWTAAEVTEVLIRLHIQDVRWYRFRDHPERGRF